MAHSPDSRRTLTTPSLVGHRHTHLAQATTSGGRWLVKVPAVTALFWLVKVVTTGMGEAASDYLAQQSLLLPGAIGILGLGTALTPQLRATRYRAVLYRTRGRHAGSWPR